MYLLVHLGGSKPVGFLEMFAVGELVHDGFHHDNSPIHDQAKINGAQTHQIASYPKHVHQDNGKKHGKRDYRSYNQSGSKITQEKDQNKDHDQCPFQQVCFDGADRIIHHFGTIQKRVDDHPFRECFLDGFNFCLDIFNNGRRILSF